MASVSDPAWIKLNNLKELYEHGFITKEDFEERKAQIVDQLTGTSSRTNTQTQTHLAEESYTTSNSFSSKDFRQKDGERGGGEGMMMGGEGGGEGGKKKKQPEVLVIARPPPDFSVIPFERAVNHMFDPDSRKWSHRNVWVKIEGEPFAKGSMRLAFHSLILDSVQSHDHEPPSDIEAPKETNVLKMSIDPFENKDTPFRDVETQMYSKQWAKRFNRYDPPKRIDFIACSILELIDRSNQPICTVEQFIAGPYRKHNNNWGYVSEDERNTPQAFSHFTYHASNGTMLICDIQGVGDLYTDPQIHTLNVLQQKGASGFGGRGNLGSQGFDKFLRSHRCNAICRYLRLPAHNAKEDQGTLPSAPVMQYGHVEIVNVHISNGNEKTPLLPKEETIEEVGQLKEERFCICTIL